MALLSDRKLGCIAKFLFIILGLCVLFQIYIIHLKTLVNRKVVLPQMIKDEINEATEPVSKKYPLCMECKKHRINKKSDNKDAHIPMSADLQIGHFAIPKPAFKLGNVIQNAEILMGISSIQRKKSSYLLETLNSLLTNHGSNFSFGIVILVAETDLTFVEETSREINKRFGKEIENGVIEVISPPSVFYPNWNTTLESSLGDKMDQVKWRSKQNLDAMYLMLHIYQQSPNYYLMLEDDIVAARNYLNIIYEKTEERKLDQSWFLLSFCTLGAIGKLFRRSSLPSYAQFLSIYWNRKPLDWLQVEYVAVRYCSFRDFNPPCNKIRDSHVPYLPPSLFQHVGKYSSLNARYRDAKAEDFKES